MESTMMGFVRGIAILAFLLGLPAIALFGVPDDVRAFLSSDFLPWNSADPALHAEHQHAAMEQGEGDHGDSQHDHSFHEPSFFSRTDSIHASHESQSGEGTADHIALASAEARVLRRPVYRPQESGKNSEVVRHVPTVDIAGQVQRASRSDASIVQQIESRLRELGALNYQLQQQAGGGHYRFVCLCENERGEQRSFDATSADRLQAMQSVLEQVTTWRKEVFSYFISGGR